MTKPRNHILLAIASLLKGLGGLNVKLEEVKTSEGTVLFADKFEAGEPVFIQQEEAQVPLPVGEYALEDGRTLVVAEEGIIGEIKEAAAPAPETPAPAAASAEGETKQYTKAEIQAIIDSALAAQTAEMSALKAELSAMKQTVVEMEKVKPITPNPEGREREHRTELSQGQPRTSFDRVMSNLWN